MSANHDRQALQEHETDAAADAGAKADFPEVERFAVLMRAELVENRRKGELAQESTVTESVLEIYRHVAKLDHAVRMYQSGQIGASGSALKVQEFAADIGNCALLLLIRLGILPGLPSELAEAARARLQLRALEPEEKKGAWYETS